MKISAVLLSWRRQYHLPAIVSHLRRFQQIDDITIWQNEVPPSPEIGSLDARVIYSPTNEVVLGRYLAAQQAAHECVFIQDDDLCVNNLGSLLAAYDEAGGQKLICNLASDKSSRHWEWWQVHHPAHCEVGFGTLMPRRVVERLLKWPYERDLLARKADKIATILNPWYALRAGPDEITRLYHAGKESGRDENALWHRADHQELTNRAVALAQEWRSQLEAAK